MTSDTAEAGRIVRRAAVLIEEKGWVRDMAVDGERMCVNAAINAAATGTPWDSTFDSFEASVLLGEWLLANGFVSESDVAVAHRYGAIGREYLMRGLVPIWNDHRVGDRAALLAVLRSFADEMDPQ